MQNRKAVDNQKLMLIKLYIPESYFAQAFGDLHTQS